MLYRFLSRLIRGTFKLIICGEILSGFMPRGRENGKRIYPSKANDSADAVRGKRKADQNELNALYKAQTQGANPKDCSPDVSVEFGLESGKASGPLKSTKKVHSDYAGPLKYTKKVHSDYSFVDFGPPSPKVCPCATTTGTQVLLDGSSHSVSGLCGRRFKGTTDVCGEHTPCENAAVTSRKGDGNLFNKLCNQCHKKKLDDLRKERRRTDPIFLAAKREEKRYEGPSEEQKILHKLSCDSAKFLKRIMAMIASSQTVVTTTPHVASWEAVTLLAATQSELDARQCELSTIQSEIAARKTALIFTVLGDPQSFQAVEAVDTLVAAVPSSSSSASMVYGGSDSTFPHLGGAAQAAVAAGNSIAKAAKAAAQVSISRNFT